MAKTIKPPDLGEAITQELTIYHKDIVDKINAAGEAAIKELVKKTKATAPKKTGSLKRNIAWKAVDDGNGGKRYVWHVKAPDYRIIHLLVHGHATKNGGRTEANPFLQNAVDQVLPAYEQSVEEALTT